MIKNNSHQNYMLLLKKWIVISNALFSKTLRIAFLVASHVIGTFIWEELFFPDGRQLKTNRKHKPDVFQPESGWESCARSRPDRDRASPVQLDNVTFFLHMKKCFKIFDLKWSWMGFFENFSLNLREKILFVSPKSPLEFLWWIHF